MLITIMVTTGKWKDAFPRVMLMSSGQPSEP